MHLVFSNYGFTLRHLRDSGKVWVDSYVEVQKFLNQSQS